MTELPTSAMRKKANELHQEALRRLPALADVTARQSPQSFLTLLAQHGVYAGYGDLPESARQAMRTMHDTYGPDLVAAYLGLVLLQAISDFETNFTNSGLQASFCAEFATCLSRMLDEIAHPGSLPPPAFDNDRFLKDLAIARLLLVPCASHLILRYSGVPRRAVARIRTLSGAVGLGTLILGKAGGFRPFLENHVHTAMLGEFNPEGRERCLQLVARLLVAWPDTRGLMGTSWYYDPAVAKHSPRLAYLHDQARSKGACFIDMGARPEATAGALSRSPTRRMLYEQGLYRPRNYMMIWARQDILRHYDPTGMMA